MPKKTKKQKILAEYRKKIKLLQQEIIFVSKTETKKENKTTSPNQKILSLEKKEEIKALSSYFLQDLKLSLLISFFLIALEILLYFAKVIK